MGGKCIGKGSFAVVRKVTHSPSGRVFACKTYNRLKLLGSLEKQNLQSEVEILKELNHPHCISFVERFEDSRHIHLIMEYGGNKTLKDLIKTYPKRLIPIHGRLSAN